MTGDPARRRAELAKIHAGAKTLALADDSYRDFVEKHGGQRSAGDLDAAGRGRVIEALARLGAFRRPAGTDGRDGGRRSPPARGQADHPQARLVRALWLSGWHLGVVSDPAETALAAFVKRQTGVDHLGWLKEPKDIAAVVEALKSMLARGGVQWPRQADHERILGMRHLAGLAGPLPRGLADRVAVMEAQWRVLIGLGAVVPSAWLPQWVRNQLDVAHPELLSPPQADEAIRRLGAWLRRCQQTEVRSQRTAGDATEE